LASMKSEFVGVLDLKDYYVLLQLKYAPIKK
jgi:hypothetical protein